MNTKTETGHAGGFILSEANGMRSRANKTVASGQLLLAGAVLGAIAFGAGSSAAFAGNTGNGVMGAITVGAGAKAGDYKLTIIEPATNAGRFSVEDPNGVEIGTGTVAVAFALGGLSFTLADGATDFIAGDGFTITVAAGSGKVKALDLASVVGGEVAMGVLISGCDASATGFNADTAAAVMVRDCELNKNELVWPAGFTDDQKATGIAQLALLGIIAR